MLQYTYTQYCTNGLRSYIEVFLVSKGVPNNAVLQVNNIIDFEELLHKRSDNCYKTEGV